VDGTRYSLYQMVSLTQIDARSPIHNCNNLTAFLPALRDAGLCIVDYHTLRRWIYKYRHQRILPPEGEEGARRGRTPLLLARNHKKNDNDNDNDNNNNNEKNGPDTDTNNTKNN